MMVLLGIPLFFMELALGQFHRAGPINIWTNICPVFTGLGYGMILVASLVGMYYNTVIAYAVFYMCASFASSVPWSTCHNSWNTENCTTVSDFNLTKPMPTNSSQLNSSLGDVLENLMLASTTNSSLSEDDERVQPTAASEYFMRYVLEINRSHGIEDIGPVKWQLALCLMAVFIMIYFALWKGVKSTGKVVWVTAIVPYIILLVLLVRGCTLPGAKNGIFYFIRPQWDKLFKIEVWVDAAAQICFSLGPGFGTLLALSSYNKFNNNCYMDALLTSCINCFTSLLAGFVVFSVLGYMAFKQHTTIEKVALGGPGLVFIVYPEAIATMTGSTFWAILFFLMLITLGLDSSFGGLEAVITGICDAYPKLLKYRELVVAALVILCLLGSLPSATYGGQYVMNLLDLHAAPKSLLLICFCEVIAVNWFYGVNNFCRDIESMIGFQPGWYWKVCWVVIAPICLMTLFILSIVFYDGIQLYGYVYPAWAISIGWTLTASSLVCIPAYMIYIILVTPGSIYQRVQQAIKPKNKHRQSANSANGKRVQQAIKPQNKLRESENSANGKTCVPLLTYKKTDWVNPPNP